MIKKLLTICILLSAFLSYSQETAIPDGAFETFLEANGMGNGIAEDNLVTTANIENVTILDVSGLDIDNLTGIEDFAALEELNCANTGINNIGTPNPVTLQRLYCQNNILGGIDISAFTNLTHFNASTTSLSRTLDVSANTKLQELIVTNNELTALTLGVHNELTTLNCSNNTISTLNLSTLPLLEVLNCETNLSLELNVTQNTVLKKLYCKENTLTNLDVTQNVLLTDLYCNQNNIFTLNLKANNLLTNLDCSSNDLVSLDLRNGNNLAITTSDLSTNTNLDCIKVDDPTNEHLDSWTKDSLTIYSLDCGETYIPDANFENYLETHTALGAIVSVGDANSMGNGIADDNYVTTNSIENVIVLDVYNLNIASLSGIEGFIALEDFTFNNNQIKTVDLTQNIALKNLSFNNNQIDTIDLSQNINLLNVIGSGNPLESIDFSQNIALSGIEIYNSSLATINISQNIALTALFISGNKLQNIDVSTNTALSIIDVSNGQLNSFDVSLLPQLRSLYCNNNQITDLDLSQNGVLKTVECTDNLLTSINLKNGNNTIITRYKSTNNPNLNCVAVDDVEHANDRWTNKDAQTFFNEDCRQTNVLDANFENYLETHNENGGTVSLGDPSSMGNGIANDNYVNTDDIENVLELSVSNMTIGDLTGIDGFTALKKLYCSRNQIKSLDVSQNAVLAELDCTNNELTGLDLTQNSLLKILNFDNNQITNIDVSQNEMLESLTFDNNKFKNIDLSKNTALNYLIGSNNLLESMDLSNNTLLNVIQLDNNQLTSLDIKNGNNGIMITFDTRNNPNLTCIQVDNVTESTNNWQDVDDAGVFNTACNFVARIAAKVFLQGAALNPNTGEESLMRDDLRVAGYIDNQSPYNLDTMNAGVLAITGENAIVDWIFIALRDANDNTLVVTDISALLQRDGDIVGFDGVSPVDISIPWGDYYVSIKHRNHLGIITAATVNLTGAATSIDFTTGSTITQGGTNALIDVGGGVFALISGDNDENGQIQNSDVNGIIQQLGASGYSKADMDMNGQVQNSDINNLLNPNIGKGEQF